MQSKNVFFAVLLAALLPALSAAFEFSTSTDAVSASWCSQGVVNAWVAGATAGSVVYFSVESGYINAVVERPQTLPDYSGSAATRITLSVPQCHLGGQDVTVTAQVCTSICETKAIKVRVDAASCPEVQCAYVIYSGRTNIVSPSPQPTAICGSVPCSEVVSSIVREGQFTPTKYAASLERTSSPRCISYPCSNDQVRYGETLAGQFKARNLGAAGSFEVTATPEDSSALTVAPKSASLELTRGESANVDFVLIPRSSASPGVYKVSYRISHGLVQLDGYTQFVEIIGGSVFPSTREARLIVAPEVTLNACTPSASVTIPVSLENPGRAGEFEVSGSLRGERAAYARVFVQERSTRNFDLPVDYSRLAVGENLLQISASSQEFAGNGAMRIVLLPCSTPEPLPTPRNAFDFAGYAGNKITIVTTVVNQANEFLPGVYGELTGLPAGWNYSSALINVPPKSEANLTLIVLATTQETATPTLIVKSGSRVIMLKQLGEINRQASLTGFFLTSISENIAILLLAMAAIAAAFLFLAARNHDEHARSISRTKATSIRREVFLGGSPSSS